MYYNTRYDLANYRRLGLTTEGPTWDNPITVVGEEFRRNGKKLYINGHHTFAQVFGSAWGSQTKEEVNAHLDKLVSVGVNMIGIMNGLEQFGRGQSGALAGRQIGCFDIGYQFSGVTNRNWQIGDKCWTTDGSGIRRVYECTGPGGVWSGSATGPTASSGSQTATCTFTYKYFVGAVYSEEFFAGSSALGSAGFDYFMHACGERGIYVTIRFNSWDIVFSGQTGYPLNGGGNLSAYFGCWPFDGEYGTPTIRTYMRNHIAKFLDRINSINGKRYGDDHTLAIINPWNEMGIAYWFYNSSSTSSPSGSSWDRMCYQGSPASRTDLANPTALFVAAWDSKFLNWYTSTYGTTPNSDYGKLNTLPCNGYTGVMGNSGAPSPVASGTGVPDARDTYRVGATGNDYTWRKRINRFLRETEANMVSEMQTWLRTKSSHVLQMAGQSAWMFPTSMNQSDMCGVHYYENTSLTSSNNFTATGKAVGGGGASWSANVLTVLLKGTGATGPDSSHPISNGQYVRVTAGGMSNEIVGPITISNSTDFTAPRVGDPGGLSTPVDCTVILPTNDDTFNIWHHEPPVDSAATRTHTWLAGSNSETNVDASGGWPGNANYGGFSYAARNAQIQGKPRFCTELGNRAISNPSASLYHITYHLFDLLQGGSGAARFGWISTPVVRVPGEHALQGDGSTFLSTSLIALMSRYITPLPTEDVTQVTGDDIDDWYSKKNTTDNYSNNGAGHAMFVNTLELSGQDSQWHSFMHNRLRTKIALSTAKTDITYTHANSGWTHPELNNANTGRLYHKRDIGTVVYENSKIIIIVGRIRATTDSTETSRLLLTANDGAYWNGLVALASLDGSDIGVGSCALFHWMYPMDELQRFRRYTLSGRTQYVELLDGDFGNTSDPKPGVVLRNDLKVRIPMANTNKRATVIERYGKTLEYPVFHSGGNMIVYPKAPLIVIG